ncbi:E3 Ubiquitin ligase [Methylophaga frappieri]|uniref:RING-type E3 ubiquitin transferase n=1 Tax=Methylophaga frappieri (strain ATCC BAA-2434 / DSM 25690 / JAM7) TaxID=754477 RepID=I1YE47_METFJ|nr:E3 Ubiquitin ligase [Methylophaga frappieri]AFJ01190.1 E3 Ubiquitin ligase [Methylophaga frappieri]
MENVRNILAGIIRSLESGEFTLASLLIIGIGAGCFYYLIQSLQRIRLLSGKPTSKIRSAHQGCIELAGSAELMPGSPVVSPVSGRHCVWYEYVIEQRQTVLNGSRERTRWSTIQRQRSDALFYLNDGSGQCVVDPDDAEIMHVKQRRWRDPVNRNRRYSERTIVPGQQLYAIGWFQTIQAATQMMLKEQVSLLLREWKQNLNQLLARFDTNKDGRFSDKEWQRVVAAANAQVRREHLTMQPDAIHLLGKGPGRSSYLISVIPEAKLRRRYQVQFWAALIGFLCCGSLWVWALQIRQVG